MSEETNVTQAIPSMAEFEVELENSFKKLKEGDIVTGTVIGVSETEVTVDLGSYSEGIIKLEELSNDPRFSIKADIQIGDEVSAEVLYEDMEGRIFLSRKNAYDILSWDALKEMQKNKTVSNVKVAEAVNSGVITYLNGIRAFIPASQLSLQYVEDLGSFVGQKLDVQVIEVNQDANKLILSAKELLKEKALEDKNSRISKLQPGLIVTGKVETIVPYGAFVNIGEDLTGLVHISQICGRRIKSPKEVIKEGDEVTVKIIDIKEGKISLSMKAVAENDEVLNDVEEASFEYHSDEEASTSLGSLLSKLKL
ncbi:S1 RNA-binding domain-containing protein [Candidatus Galacturonibacter soehngenii]|uniref:S1 RNA-binding domain-containing protein n=1 Tax=Candidatus Galacturonatibacter soehngenii TaxID=2307010 RepID=A0A7V7QKC2_9FIRM|nr:S1 RNA-binding domain-containing protein [Candidatus Galacturonibacter soehngenii]KAB1438096.1 S1 RNA-binding domain-containing protein [Candidatus Galacturonibacter soehngenii]MBA4687146.1 S1 RNA-binding domain-containing protein [Candidatus Galacturonibacter soehngenii]